MNAPLTQVGKPPKVNDDEFSKKFEGKDICNEWCPIKEAYGDLLDQVLKSKHRIINIFRFKVGLGYLVSDGT
jgi:hypothetical protein